MGNLSRLLNLNAPVPLLAILAVGMVGREAGHLLDKGSRRGLWSAVLGVVATRERLFDSGQESEGDAKGVSYQAVYLARGQLYRLCFRGEGIGTPVANILGDYGSQFGAGRIHGWSFRFNSGH